MTQRPSGATLAAFAGFVVIAGCNVVAVKISNEGLAPFWGAALRFGGAGLVFGWILILGRVPFPRGRALGGALVYGALAFGLSYALAYWSLLGIPAGLLGVLMATVPLLTLLLASLQGLERFSARGVGGAVLSLVGILIMVRVGLGAEISLGHLVAGALMPLAVAESTIVAKKFPQNHPVATNAIGMLVGAVLLLAASAVAGETHGLPRGPRVVGALLYLVLIGSLVMFTLFLFVLRRWSASATSYQAVLSPIVTALVATRLVDEPITAALVLGGGLVLAGVYVGAVSRRPARPMPPSPEPAAGPPTPPGGSGP